MHLHGAAAKLLACMAFLGKKGQRCKKGAAGKGVRKLVACVTFARIQVGCSVQDGEGRVGVVCGTLLILGSVVDLMRGLGWRVKARNEMRVEGTNLTRAVRTLRKPGPGTGQPLQLGPSTALTSRCCCSPTHCPGWRRPGWRRPGWRPLHRTWAGGVKRNVQNVPLSILPPAQCWASDMFTGPVTSIPVTVGEASIPVTVGRLSVHVVPGEAVAAAAAALPPRRC